MASAIAAIPRIGFDKLLSDERRELANNAASKLGYNRLALAISAPGALLYALRELAIEPLEVRAVKAYQQSKEQVGMWSGTKWSLIWAAMCLVCVSAAAIIRVNFSVPTGFALMLFIPAIAGAVWGFSGFVFWGALGEHIGHGDRIVTNWAKCGLQNFSGVVPEFALEKAVSIKNARPNATFEIEYLQRGVEHKEIPLPDPFLVVCEGTERYYFEVWEEAEFKL